MSVLLFHCIFSEKISLWASRMEILLTVYDLKLLSPSTVLPRELVQYHLIPYPCLYFSSLHPFFFFQGNVSKARLWWSSWQSLAATCTRSSTSNGRKLSTHKGKTVQGVGFSSFICICVHFLTH